MLYFLGLRGRFSTATVDVLLQQCMLCNNANKQGRGGYTGGGAIAAQPAIRINGGVSRYRGAIAAIVSQIAL